MPSEWKVYARADCFYAVSHDFNKKNLPESEFREYLLNDARAEVARQIKIIVNDVSSLQTNSVNGKGEIIYRASSNFSTDVTLRYLKTRCIYDARKREGYAIAWISKSELQNIYDERAAKVVSMLDVSARAEQEHKYDIALKYAYWALVLSYTLPEDMSVVYPQPQPGHPSGAGVSVKLHARSRIEAILSGIEFRFAGISEEDPLLGRLDVTCDGNVVSSLDYAYNDGMGISPSTQVKDGEGIIEFRAGLDVRNIDIQVEYAYEDESNSDPEMKMALAEVAQIKFPDALKRGVSVSVRKTPRPAAHKRKASPAERLAEDVSEGFEKLGQSFSPAASLSSSSAEVSSRPSPSAAGRDAMAPDSSALCLEAVAQVLDAVGRHAYSEVKELFTEEGYDIFEKLLHYGNAKILDRSHIQAVPYAYGYVCRSIPMKFTFKTNKKSFIENVVFWWDKEGKIDNLTFALDAESVKGILSKTKWTDGAKMALISFLENYKTAFALARLDYIDAIFSDDALIIVGRVVKKTEIEGGIKMEREDVEYNRYTKAAYLSQLRRSFASKEYVNLKFANTEITKLTRGGHENFYGIQLKQDYFSSNYGDSGYLYLLVDMEDSREPLIYVRTWQPQPDPDFGLYGPGII
ncbi:MAG: hypothetical protein IJU13_08155 [Bacteroidales bacterium]|nr:hypothetical protein [Bacteroidales bacterium]